VIAGSAGFAAASGSTVVNAVVFTRLALPEMLKYKYSRSLSLGCICAAGTFAAMIPPSLTMVIYAIITEQSIGKLLLAGVIPGIISAILYAVLILTLVRFKPSLAPAIPQERFSLMDRIRSLKGVWGIALLILLVLGGIYSGLFPPSGAGAVGAFGTFAIALFKLGPKKSWLMEGLRNSAAVACTIFTILIGGLIFSRLLVITGVITEFTQFVTVHIHTAAGIMVAFSLMYIIMGCYLDTASMMIITLPFVFPVIVQYGINPIWFGIIFVKVIEISVITPPVGLNLYAVMSGAGKDANFRDLVFGVIPFIMMDLFTLAILIIFPGLSTWLPETMMGN
jgi:tripartite ATP-independent transporter DctM subunit